MPLDLPPNYDDLGRFLSAVELAPSPAEAQAILCGLLAAKCSDAHGLWRSQLRVESDGAASDATATGPGSTPRPEPLDLTHQGRCACGHPHDHQGQDCEPDPSDPGQSHGEQTEAVSLSAQDQGAALTAALDALGHWTETAIAPPSMSFELFLPAEDRPLAERATAVHDWVRGLLYGLALGQFSHEQLPDEEREAFDDLVELTHMDLSGIEEGEQDEQALAEIIEFLRIAPMVLRDATSDASGRTASLRPESAGGLSG